MTFAKRPEPGRMPSRSASSLLIRFVLVVFLVSALTTFSPAVEHKKVVEEHSILWTDPGDIKSRDLFYGPGGQEGQPKLPVTFLKEDASGYTPKFDVRDAAGKKWKAKMGIEAQTEPVASRLLWAVGYFANENYFFPILKVEALPPRLTRGQEFVGADGEVRGVRLQIHPDSLKKVKTWSWHKNSFTHTREFDGLRVMMALLNNWDLKDDNNGIFANPDDPEKKIYGVSDVGASFGSTGESYTSKRSKGNLPAYRHAKFLKKVARHHVDFNFPTHLPFLYIFNLPHFLSELHNRSIGKHISRADAIWAGSLLVQLTPEQIRDAFRAGGYSPEQAEAFASVVEKRIAQLNAL
jgi:hypothetical protein